MQLFETSNTRQSYPTGLAKFNDIAGQLVYTHFGVSVLSLFIRSP